MAERQRLVLVERRLHHTKYGSFTEHHADLDDVVATMTERAREGRAGDLGYDVVEVEIVRRVQIRPQITAVDVTEETPDG